MASKRLLKKNFRYFSSDMYEDLITTFLQESDEAKQGKLLSIIDEFLIWADDIIKRISHTNGSKNKKIVKSYYRNLKQDIIKKEQTFLK